MTKGPFTDFAIELARRAGSHLMAMLPEVMSAKQVRLKSPFDVVTRGDKEVERMIADAIRSTFPDHGLLAEEGTAIPGREYRWIVDPLDGTTNFAHGVPWFAVSIALARASQTVLGVVYHPPCDEMFLAEAGRGAWLLPRDGTPVRLAVSTTLDLASSLLATGFGGGDLTQEDLEPVPRMIIRVRGLRNMGSAATHLAYVAAGRVDGFWEPGLNPWDIAAGILLVLEAGGRVTDMEGRLLQNGNVLATNGRVHEAMLRVIVGH